MQNLDRWKNCSIIPNKGMASFDGVEILADGITNPRYDRVMPLYEEEQILMCRVMLERLRPDDLVLDVGTGSGVFAIWAATKKRCRVIAVDISRRAIRFAKKNALANGVTTVSTPSRLAIGTICLIHQDIADFVPVALTNEWEFDVVILNPPFNPTCPALNPAVHANAGPKGQSPFMKQIRLAPKVQKLGGYCLGYQMSYDKRKGAIDALDRIALAYRRRCSIEYAHVLEDVQQFPVGRFLRSQYSGFLAEQPDSISSGQASAVRRNLTRYLRTTGRPGTFFSLIYYEVRKENSTAKIAPREVDLPAKPPATWASRIALHRSIVDHTVPNA